MPTSPYDHIYTFVEFLNETRPASLLDIGLGNGKLGFIARDVLDVMLGGHYRREDWKVRIDGIEMFPDYIQAHQKAIYDQICVGNAYEVIDTLGTYDMVVIGDVLEHFHREIGWQLLKKCIAHANTHLCLFVPLGDSWTQPEICGNLNEKHLSFWQADDFVPFAAKQKYFHYRAGDYGAFLIIKEDFIDYQIKQLYGSKPTATPPPADTLRQKYGLTKENINAVDLAPFCKYVANDEHRAYFCNTVFKEHYRLIAYLSTLFHQANLFDIGTNKGYSALALAYNPSNRLISYDIVECKELNYVNELTNIEYLIGNVLDDDRLLGAPLIMLDTDHDGIFENQAYRYLKQRGYKGLLFLDDINLTPPMKSFWASITDPKIDITDLGHWSGSGLVDFG